VHKSDNEGKIDGQEEKFRDYAETTQRMTC